MRFERNLKNSLKSYSYIVILNGTNKGLAELEFLNLFRLYFSEEILFQHLENTFYRLTISFPIEEKTDFQEFCQRLTYTNQISKILVEKFKLSSFKFSEETKAFIQQFNERSFIVRIKRANKRIIVPFTESEGAKVIWNFLKKPKVSFKEWDIKFVYYIPNNDMIYLCYEIFQNKKEYLNRMPKNRPISMPYTLRSDLARASVNLLNCKKGFLFDPFCGIGGIALEMLDMNFKVVCNDISYNDLKYLQINVKNYFNSTKNILVTLSDCRDRIIKEETIAGIVTDVPYGRCSRKLGEELYLKFLENSHKVLMKGGRLVVIYANFCGIEKYFDKFTLISKTEEYINKSMTRVIAVLEPKK